jgi:hypothetical protein
MKTYILVDFENAPIQNTDFLSDQDAELLIFIGKTQAKLSADLVLAVQELGSRARYIRMDGSGKNALDFHIAYYLGQLSAQDTTGRFVVLSKDTGFDPLIAHLAAKGRVVRRIPDTKSFKPDSPSPVASSGVERAIKQLKALGKARPLTIKKLHNTLQDLLGRDQPLSEDELCGIVATLQTRGLLEVNATKVNYTP